MADQRLIVALDVQNEAEAKKLVQDLGDAVNFYKVGMELYYAVGRDIVSWLKQENKHVFVDLKLHDIPNTVAGAVRSLIHLGADFIDVHASGGAEMMKRAAEAAREEAERLHTERPKLLAVTILTSISEAEWNTLDWHVPLEEQALHFAHLAQEAGMDGVIASPMEAQTIREACGKDFLIVTPGVRPAGSAINDQSRITTPAIALESGASYLVIGRPIREAMRPRHAAEKILQEMQEAHVEQ